MSFADIGGGGGRRQRGRGGASGYQNADRLPQPGGGGGGAGDAARTQQHIQTNLAEMRRKVQELENGVGQLGSDRDTNQLRAQLKQARTEASHLAQETLHLLKKLGKSGVKGSKTTSQKLGRDVQQVLANFKEVSQRYNSKMGSTVATMKASMSSNSMSGDGFTGMSSSENESASLLQDSRMSQAQQQMTVTDMRIDQNEKLIEDRENEIQNIERTVNDVNEIFQDLAQITEMYNPMIENIETNVTNVKEQTIAANKELLQANKYANTSRKAMCCLLPTLMIVVAIIVLYLVFKKPKPA